ncbi:hypothetical protein ACOMHN_056234 [Nucella lapillus]
MTECGELCGVKERPAEVLVQQNIYTPTSRQPLQDGVRKCNAKMTGASHWDYGRLDYGHLDYGRLDYVRWDYVRWDHFCTKSHSDYSG